jgi:CheY-like chemotaxis protein
MAKIIFCEDDPSVQKLVRVALRSTPHEIHIAGNGAEGLELVERELPDAVFTDISMPVLDGLQLVSELQARPQLKHIPVVIVTASVQRHQVEEAYRHGIADHLSKPFSVHDLRAKVEQFAAGARCQR